MSDSRTNTTVKSVQVLDRAKLILEILADGPCPLSLLMLSRKAELHPSTAHRIIWNLAASGFVERVGNDWRLGLRFLDYGTRYQAQSRLVGLARPFLASLAKTTRQDVLLALRDGGYSMVIDQVVGQSNRSEAPSRIGSRKALHRCGSGMVFLSQMSADALSGYFTAFRETESAKRIESLLVQIHQIRERGWAEHPAPNRIGNRSVALGLDVGESKSPAALVLVVQDETPIAPTWIEALRRCGTELSATLVTQA